MNRTLNVSRGLTVIELLVVLVISSLLIAGVYRTFISQQKTYTVQEQVVDAQQGVRGALHMMMREIKMAGFGNVSMVLPVTLGGQTFSHVVNADSPSVGSLTLLTGLNEDAVLTATGGLGQNQVVVSRLADSQGTSLFDTGERRYVSIGGVESHSIVSIDPETRTITLDGSLIFNHAVGTPVFGIRALTFQAVVEDGVSSLERYENLGNGELVVDHVENLQFGYFDADGNPAATPEEVRLVRVSLTVKTSQVDADLPGDGYRRRQIASNIHLRNMGLEP